MARRQGTTESLPACYALMQPGLESVAAEEIETELGGDIKKTASGTVVFRVSEIDQELLRLRTIEDVFLLAWGTDQLSYRATDLEKIRRWTAQDARWDRLLQLHHAIRPKPKGKPSYRLVTQMTGEHGYRRTDARMALAEGLAGKLPASWKHAEENAAVEIWLTIDGATAVCGLRLSDRTMRHRTYKLEHQPASLRPTVAAAMARLAQIKSGHVVLDPMCGAGTILAEIFELGRQDRIRHGLVIGGDIEVSALRAAGPNLRPLGQASLFRWDATRLPLASQSVDRIVCNPPFGKQLVSPEMIPGLYRRLVQEWQRVLRPRGQAVLLVSDFAALGKAAAEVRWRMGETVRLQVLGQRAAISVWHTGVPSVPE
jgi:23S rRNA G2445 N2-methylase RlmL